jgi:hypothetical protein
MEDFLIKKRVNKINLFLLREILSYEDIQIGCDDDVPIAE